MRGEIPLGSVQAMTRDQKSLSIDETTREDQIAYKLGIGRAYYSTEQQRLYFSDTELVPLKETIIATLSGLNLGADIHPLYLDTHKIFSTASWVDIRVENSAAVLVALRLIGVRT